MMLGKILKDKEKRDTALLIVMGLITIAFLLYIFIPAGSEKEIEKPVKTGNGNQKNQQKKIEKKTPVNEPPPTEEKNDEKKHFCDLLNEKLEYELNSIYLGILVSNDPFENFWVDTLEKVFDDFEDDTLSKFRKFSFYDLDDITSLPIPPEFNDTLKFNLLVSLVLIKMKEEGISEKFETIPNNELRKTINFDFYGLINNEVQKDYQLMPVLFYYTVLMKRLHIYPEIDGFRFFKSRIGHIRDLTPGKYLIRLKESLCFSASLGKYRIQWEEHDSIGANDNRVYGNLSLKTFTFLRQDYLIFPDLDNPENNLWIKELREADSGEIELIDLHITGEDHSNPLEVKKIYYAPVSSRFVVLLKEYEPGKDDGYLNAIVTKRMTDFHKSLREIDFSLPVDKEGKKAFKTQLDKFGNYLKKLAF